MACGEMIHCEGHIGIVHGSNIGPQVDYEKLSGLNLGGIRPTEIMLLLHNPALSISPNKANRKPERRFHLATTTSACDFPS